MVKLQLLPERPNLLVSPNSSHFHVQLPHQYWQSSKVKYHPLVEGAKHVPSEVYLHTVTVMADLEGITLGDLCVLIYLILLQGEMKAVFVVQ